MDLRFDPDVLARTDRLVVRRLGNSTVLVARHDGSELGRIRNVGQPSAAAVDPINNVHVCDEQSDEIVTADCRGRVVRVFGSPFLCRPDGIAVAQNRLFVADGNGLHCFLLDGSWLWSDPSILVPARCLTTQEENLAMLTYQNDWFDVLTLAPDGSRLCCTKLNTEIVNSFSLHSSSSGHLVFVATTVFKEWQRYVFTPAGTLIACVRGVVLCIE